MEETFWCFCKLIKHVLSLLGRLLVCDFEKSINLFIIKLFICPYSVHFIVMTNDHFRMICETVASKNEVT